MRHGYVWTRLPDLLEDRDQPSLLAHVAICHACQRQLFLLEQVDRLLRETAVAEQRAAARAGRRWARSPAAVAAAAVAAAAAALFAGALAGPQGRDLTLRSVSGKVVGHARLTPADRDNISVLLVTDGLPVRHDPTYVLWARGTSASARVVGRFMISSSGSCRARFNLPANRRWMRLWITPPARPDTIVAAT